MRPAAVPTAAPTASPTADDRYATHHEGSPRRRRRTVAWQALRWVGRLTAVVAFVLLFLTLPAACQNTIIPPASPHDPVDVFVLVHGRTVSLVLPTPEGGTARYAVGDWRWYSLGETQFHRGVAALFWPTPAGFGRRVMEAPSEPQAVRQAVKVSIDELHVVPVARVEAAALQQRLERRFGYYRATEVARPEVDFDFVRVGQPYWYFYNSNQVVADWLQELGCVVRGPAYGSRWQVLAD